MADRNKGFDPLASLFEAPEAGLASPDETSADPAPSVEPAPAPGAGATPEPEPAESAAPAAPPRPPLDKAAIARSVAQAATARLSAQTAAGASAQPKPGAEPVVDKLAVARAVAQAAAARLAAESAAASPPATPAKSAPPPKSRLDRLASRAVRPRSALDAARAAAQAEASEQAEVAEAKAVARKEKLSGRVQAMVAGRLPGLGRFQVERSIFADQRPVLQALWKGHRAKFLADGQLERAVGAAAVLHGLGSIPKGRLVAAHVETDASDYLVWIELDVSTGEGSLLAAFSDARSYFAGG